LFFEKNANLFAENWQKSQKIVILTPGANPKFVSYNTSAVLICNAMSDLEHFENKNL
jgi:hypothetical protein